MSEVNKIQHGGDHYRSEYQHWDLCADVGMGYGYFVAAASKYVARHKKKNGLQDLQKAGHYVAKLIELVMSARVSLPRRTRKEREAIQRDTERFLRSNKCDHLERLIISLLVSPRSLSELESAAEFIEDLIVQASVEQEIVESRVSTALTVEDFLAEGWKGGEIDCYQCRKCRVHVEVPAGTDPSRVHDCTKPPDDGSDATYRGYVDQGHETPTVAGG